MGNSSHSLADKQLKELLSQYQILQERTKQNITYLEHKKSSKQYLLREMAFNDRKQFEKAFDLLKVKKTQLEGCQHITPLVKYITRSQDQFCSTFYKIYALFEYPQRSLDDQINQRNLQKRRFQQKQLWSILASCILALSHLQKNNTIHNSLRSSNILLSEEGIIKISDPYTTGCQSNYQTLLSNRSTQHIYLSPQQASALEQQIVTPQNLTYKSDIWTLGMIILQAALLQYQDQCYRDEGARVHWQTLNYNLNRFGQIYSQELKNMIQLMLSRDQKTRPQWLDLQQHVIKVDQQNRGGYLSNQEIGMSIKPKVTTQDVITQKRPTSNLKQSNGLGGQITTMSFNPATPRQFNPPNPTPLKTTTPQQQYPQHPQLFVTPNNYQQIPPQISSHLGPKTNNYLPPTMISGNLLQVNPSIIDNTRPLKSVFPLNTYYQKTKIDENLVVIEDDEEMNNFSKDNYEKMVPNLNMEIGKRVEQRYEQHLSINKNVNNINSYQKNNQQQIHSINFNPGTSSTQNHAPNQSLQYKVQIFKKGSKYQGYKLNGMRHGQGKFYYQDGGMYDGQWNSNRMEGFGKLYYQSGKLAYQGQWMKDQFSGSGTLFNQTPDSLRTPFNYRNFDGIDEYWTKYEGNFFQDNKHGKGKLYLSNGEYFEGQFKSDVIHGYGIFHTMNGNIINGKWNNNNFVG